MTADSPTQRAYSIKTRIKTPRLVASLITAVSAQRAYSIKTRIKTQFLRSHLAEFFSLREHIPLKQGLRLSESIVIFLVSS